MAKNWHRGVLEPPEKSAVDWKSFEPFLGHFLMTSLFSTNPRKQDFQKSSKKGISIVPSERRWKVDDKNGVICKISSFRSPKMAPNGPKSSIFLDDVISYPGNSEF